MKRHLQSAIAHSAGLDAIRPYIKGAPVFITTVKLQVQHTSDAHVLKQSYSRKVEVGLGRSRAREVAAREVI